MKSIKLHTMDYSLIGVKVFPEASNYKSNFSNPLPRLILTTGKISTQCIEFDIQIIDDTMLCNFLAPSDSLLAFPLMNTPKTAF